MAARVERHVTIVTSCLLLLICSIADAFIEMPKFKQLKLLYPGWRHHGGDYHDNDILHMIGSNDTRDFTHLHNTASLRMSWALNRYGGRHSIGMNPVYLSGQSRDSMTGSDGVEYIYRNTAFGPYLALRYGDPTVIRQLTKDVARTMRAYEGKQGIMRFVSYHGDHAGGHIALWDCYHFHQSRDFTAEHNVIAVEFWETPDSYCPTPMPQLAPHLEALDLGTKVKVIARHNTGSGSQRQFLKSERRERHLLRKMVEQETLWIQDES